MGLGAQGTYPAVGCFHLNSALAAGFATGFYPVSTHARRHRKSGQLLAMRFPTVSTLRFTEAVYRQPAWGRLAACQPPERTRNQSRCFVFRPACAGLVKVSDFAMDCERRPFVSQPGFFCPGQWCFQRTDAVLTALHLVFE